MTYLILIYIFLSTYSYARPIHLCFATSSENKVSLSALRQDYLWRAVELAYIDWKKKGKNKEIKIQKLGPFNTDLELVKNIYLTAHKDCSSYVGLITSSEAVLAGPHLAKNNIFAISSTASHPDVNKSYPYLLSARPIASDTAQFYVKNIGLDSKVFIIREKEDIYSRFYTEEIYRLMTKKPDIIDIIAKGEVAIKDLKLIKESTDPYIIFTTQALKSLPALVSITRDLKGMNHLTMLGSPSWGLVPQTILSHTKNLDKKTEILLPTALSEGHKQLADFKTSFLNKYKYTAEEDAAFMYDATAMMLQCLDILCDKKGSPIRPAAISRCIQNLKYNGVTGSFHYSSLSSFPKKEIFFKPLSFFKPQIQ